MIRALLLALLSAAVAAAADVEQWGTYELRVPLAAPVGNPYLDVQLSARFAHGAETVNVMGFYDGPDGGFKIRFMPPSTGRWHYLTSTGQTGEIDVGPPSAGNHGPVRVAHTYHFAYADGSPYWQIGTTCYSWVFAGEAREQETLQTLAASPFNKLRMCVLPQDFAPVTVFPYEGTPPHAWDTTRFNPAFFRHLEERVRDLEARGIEADLILFHPYDKKWGFSNLSPAEDDRYVRYVVARLAAYRNVWWSLANEYDFIRTKSEADWDRLFQLVTRCDPYGHLCSIHNGSRIYNHTHPWVTHASIQNGSAVEDPGRAILYRDVYRKPIVYDEVKYEGDIGRRWGNLSGEELVLRFWCGTVAGTYVGHSETFRRSTYTAHGATLTDADASWLGMGGRLIGASPPRLAFLKRILEDAPPEGIEPIDKWQDEPMGGQPGKYYLVYFGRTPPSRWPFVLYKDGLKPGMTFHADILDTWNMTITPVPAVFKLKRRDSYTFADVSDQSIPLPPRRYLALRIRRNS